MRRNRRQKQKRWEKAPVKIVGRRWWESESKYVRSVEGVRGEGYKWQRGRPERWNCRQVVSKLKKRWEEERLNKTRVEKERWGEKRRERARSSEELNKYHQDVMKKKGGEWLDRQTWGKWTERAIRWVWETKIRVAFKVIKKKGGKYQKDESRCEGKLECRCYERRWDTEVRLTEVRYELSFESCWQKATVQQDEERDFTFLPCGRVVLVYVNKILKSKILKLNKVK